jgi:SPP1 family predicted phage head-tail adaptor
MKPAAKTGELDKRVRFDKQVSTGSAAAGGETLQWQPQFTRWARIINQKGGEGVQSQRLQGTQPAIIIVRYDSATLLIEPSWRAVRVVDGVDRDVYALKTAVDMEGRNQFISMQAVSGEPDA